MADRLYKLMLESIALLARLTNACIMKFPRNLAELNDNPAEFCASNTVAMANP